MPKSFMRGFELLLVIVVGASIVLGVTWGADVLPTPVSPMTALQQPQAQPRAAGTLEAIAMSSATQNPLQTPDAAMAQPIVAPIENTATPGALDTAVVKTPVPFSVDMTGVEEGDAPLIEQAPGTLNILLLGTDASADQKYARTDSVMIASVNPDFPSVSLLSFPRDLVVKIPGFGTDRINTAYERGYIANYPGGGPGFLGLVLRKNFGIRIDHFVRIDFQGFIKAIDTLGGVEVLAECELHDTFPDKSSANGKTDLDVYPGRVTLSGKQALWFSRSRWSTTDFDRARRQQKVIRAVIKKARNSNLLQNAISLYGDFRNYLETDIGITDLPKFIEIAQRLGDLQMKSRVITFGIVRAYSRPSDGASVLIPTDKTIPFIKEALSPPSGNQAQVLPVVEVYNGSTVADMEFVAAERLAWEGFNVVAVDKMPAPEFKENQLVVYTTSSKGSPIPKLVQIFNVKQKNIINELDPSSASAARIVLGENYNPCPATASMGQDVTLQTEQEKLLPTPTVGAP
jgi:polyisoprenyl-teichoic acid--peptidoglycan teichoic acid transferase